MPFDRRSWLDRSIPSREDGKWHHLYWLGNYYYDYSIIVLVLSVNHAGKLHIPM